MKPWTKPSFFSEYKRGMKRFGECIAAIINVVLLTVVYVVGVGLTAIVARLFRKQFLDTKLDKKTYWKAVPQENKTMEDYYRQF